MGFPVRSSLCLAALILLGALCPLSLFSQTESSENLQEQTAAASSSGQLDLKVALGENEPQPGLVSPAAKHDAAADGLAQSDIPPQLAPNSGAESLDQSALLPGKLAISAAAGVVNRYAWRGMRLTDGAVSQQSVTVGGGNFSFTLWANLDISDANGLAGRYNELDYTLDYSFQIRQYSISLGAIEYTFPNTEFSSTSELYLALGVEMALNPKLSVYRDVDEADGTYVNVTFGHSIALEALNTALELNAGLGWGSKRHNEFYYGVSRNAGTDLLFGLGLPFAFNDYCSLTPSIGYNGLLNGDLRNNAGHKDNLLVGITLSTAF